MYFQTQHRSTQNRHKERYRIDQSGASGA